MALFQPWESVTTGRVIDTFQNHFLKSVIHAAAGKNLAKAIDNHDLVRKRKEALLAAVGLLKEVRQKGIADNPDDRELIISEANKALDIASEKVGAIVSDDEQETIDIVQAACAEAKIKLEVKQESKMSTIRTMDTEREFCEKIDARVAEFNRIAEQEILQEPLIITALDGIDSIQGAIAASTQDFQENLNRTTFPNKLEALKGAFGQIADLGMDAVIAVALEGVEASKETIEKAIQRLTHVLDVMNNDELTYAPELVKSDALYKDEKWKPLRAHRDQVSDQLRDQLSTLIERQPSMMPV